MAKKIGVPREGARARIERDLPASMPLDHSVLKGEEHGKIMEKGPPWAWAGRN